MFPTLGLILAAASSLPSASPSPSPSPSSGAAVARAGPVTTALPPVVINGIYMQAVQIAATPVTWRNIAITVTSTHVQAWRALTTSAKSSYAQQMIDLYRTGTKFAGNIKLTFIDEQNGTLDQYLWTPPAAPVH